MITADTDTRLRDDAPTVAVARMLHYRRTRSSPGMPAWYLRDFRERMTPVRYAAPAYTPARYVTRLTNDTHRAWVFERFTAEGRHRTATLEQYVAAFERANGHVPGGWRRAA